MKIGQAVVPILERSFEKLASGQLTFKAQNDSEASYCQLNKIDGLIDFNLSSEAIYNRWGFKYGLVHTFCWEMKG